MSNDDLQQTLIILIDALLRKDTDQDGNWGYPSFRRELTDLLETLKSGR